MAYRFVSWVFRLLIRTLSKSRIEGHSNLPTSGAYLIVANHMSMVDIPLGFAYMADPNISGWAAAKWARHVLLAPIVRILGARFIQRGEVDRTALQFAIDWLKSGKPFALSPEGTRSRNGSLQRGKTGAAYLASEADVPVVPIGVIGTDQAFRTLLLGLKRPELALRVGEPFRLPPIDQDNRNVSLRSNTDEIMCRLAALLPERYWGYYADHPRLKELLEEQTMEEPSAQMAGNLAP